MMTDESKCSILRKGSKSWESVAEVHGKKLRKRVNNSNLLNSLVWMLLPVPLSNGSLGHYC